VIDVAIIGGGPAGATAGRLLAQWGHAVTILAAPSSKRPGLAECLPPSTRKLFQFLGIQDTVDNAGFLRTTGNTVWWGKSGRRVEDYPDSFGYQVLRHDFDRLLLELALGAGARVAIGKALRNPSGAVDFESEGSRTSVRARFIIDCSGRAGVLARPFRLREKNSRTVALCGVWHSERGWKVPDASHTLVESYADGWAWSVPVSPTVRYVAFMVGPGETKMVRGKGLAVAYQAELLKTRAFRKIFQHGSMSQAPWGADASLYSARQFSGPGFLLAGDAASFIDPLSSFGVKKAMVSAWVAAVVANTCLRHAAMQQIALQFFDDRERQVYSDYLRQTAGMFGQAAGSHKFWINRSEFSTGEHAPQRAELQSTFDKLKRKRALHLRRADGVRTEPRPRIEGNEVVLRDTLIVPGTGETLDFYESVDLARLAEIAEHHRQVPDLFEAYNRASKPIPLPNFLAALSFLLARKILLE
jgi:flavin-dependent dehydrogenase